MELEKPHKREEESPTDASEGWMHLPLDLWKEVAAKGRFTLQEWFNFSIVCKEWNFCVWKTIRVIELNGWQRYKVTDDVVARLVVQCDKLQHINLRGCVHVTDTTCQHLTKIKATLKALQLSQCERLTDEGLEWIGQLTNLQRLSLYCCHQLTDRGIQHLSKLTNLVQLDLSDVSRLTNHGLQYLSSLSQLEQLDLGRCFQICPTKVIELIRSSFPNFKAVNMQYHLDLFLLPDPLSELKQQRQMKHDVVFQMMPVNLAPCSG